MLCAVSIWKDRAPNRSKPTSTYSDPDHASRDQRHHQPQAEHVGHDGRRLFTPRGDLLLRVRRHAWIGHDLDHGLRGQHVGPDPEHLHTELPGQERESRRGNQCAAELGAPEHQPRHAVAPQGSWNHRAPTPHRRLSTSQRNSMSL
jgi:hypothetical protein